MSCTSVLLPEPLTPVTMHSTPKGNSTVMLFRLLPRSRPGESSRDCPGHLVPEAATGISSVEHTKKYLLAFEEELGKAADAAALKAAIEARFPGLGMGVALDIGSKVAKGEIKSG